uniref:CRAL-TRIO domain-containing protein n=1 Tax=Rhabditophanes sp. KR3021 TaxID=114890 RepID=A0AC35THY2_9BILA
MSPNKVETLSTIESTQLNWIKPMPFDEKTLAHASTLKTKFKSFLPQDLTTQFFLARWVRMYKGDEEQIEARLREYIRHRKGLGYDGDDYLQVIKDLQFPYKVLSKFSVSKLKQTNYSGDVVVYLQQLNGTDIKEIIKTIPFSNILHTYFILQECMLRAIHEHEAKTGRQSCAVIVLDMDGINLGDFVNPLANATKLARLVVKIWSDYFTETMTRLFLVRPPGILSLMWQLAKFILDEKTSSQVVFVQKFEDIKEYLDEATIPIAWGGSRIDTSGWSEVPANCLKNITKITPDMYYDAEAIFVQNGLNIIPPLKTLSAKKKTTEKIVINAKEGQKIVWHYVTYNELFFDVVYKNDSNSDVDEDCPIIPGTYGTCLKCPEQGVIEVKKDGEYHFRWNNVNGGWLAAKIQYAIVVV